MSSKQINVVGIGPVTIYKRRGVRNIRLSITHDGKVRITLPLWAPYKLGEAFAEQKKSWLAERKPQPQLLRQNARIGKAHQIVFEYKAAATASSRVANNSISIVVPLGLLMESPSIQEVARQASIRALKKEAGALLPRRLSELAEKHGFEYKSVKIKQMRGRWGSCSRNQDIVLNCYLMQLPWELIDYVILHELLHTKILAHGKPFWDELGRHVPNLAQVRKKMRKMQPTLHSISNPE